MSERKILIEVSERELQLINAGKLESQKPLLEEASTQELIDELFKRTSGGCTHENHYDNLKHAEIISIQGKGTFWVDFPRTDEMEERVFTISVQNTGLYKPMEEK